jgi:hypothetical protein
VQGKGRYSLRFVKTKQPEKRNGRMPIRTVRITSEHREELIQLCRQYSDLQKKAVEIRCALNDQVAALAELAETGEVAGLSTGFTQIEVVGVEEWKEALLNVTASERWVCTGFGPTGDRPPATASDN